MGQLQHDGVGQQVSELFSAEHAPLLYTTVTGELFSAEPARQCPIALILVYPLSGHVRKVNRWTKGGKHTVPGHFDFNAICLLNSKFVSLAARAGPHGEVRACGEAIDIELTAIDHTSITIMIMNNALLHGWVGWAVCRPRVPAVCWPCAGRVLAARPRHADQCWPRADRALTVR